VVGKPTPGTIVDEGQDGRYTLGGTWYFRQDDERVGLAQRFFEQEDLTYWSAIDLPNVWNAQDFSENRSSVGWYRKEFQIPRHLCVKPPEPREPGEKRKKAKEPEGPQPCDRYRWVVTFLGANHTASVWLNGRKIGAHNGGYSPFELALPGLREGRNTLVVRVSTLRGRADLTHWRAASYNGYGTGGWWNFGGLQREVWLRRIDGIDVEALTVLPRLPRLKGPARVEATMRVRSFSAERERVRLSLVLTDRKRRRTFDVGERVFEPGAEREIRARFTIDKPRLWQPRKGAMYGLAAIAATEPPRSREKRQDFEPARSAYRASFGVRQIKKLSNGVVLFNGRKMRVRGASIHEDHPFVGSAWRDAHRKEALANLRRLRATITRAHYPLHPAMLEMLDRAGILVWSQAPVYQLPNSLLDLPGVRRSALEANRRTVAANVNHPSILAWSMANELGSEPSELGVVGSGYSAFVNETARMIRGMDDTRLVAIDRHSRLGELPYYPALAGLDAIGVNEYFGWYNASIPGQPESRTEDLLPWLDGIHQQYPRTALFITEYGAESTRDGPANEKGTFAFQDKWLTDHALIHGARSFVNGSIVWALRDFRVHPTWGGGNPIPAPPWNNKGLIHEGGTPKPAFWVMARLFRGTNQFK
jgi:beta-glucuronidase